MITISWCKKLSFYFICLFSAKSSNLCRVFVIKQNRLRFETIITYIICGSLATTGAMAQKERVRNQPYADLKWLHLGFHVGIHSQDLLLTHTGVTTNGETWFMEIPSYSPGFSVGVIGDMYMNPYFNLRFTPSIHFGDKKFKFREQATGEEFITNVRSSYLNFPFEREIFGPPPE